MSKKTETDETPTATPATPEPTVADRNRENAETRKRLKAFYEKNARHQELADMLAGQILLNLKRSKQTVRHLLQL